MTDNENLNQTPETTNTETNTQVNYIEAMAEMRKSMVSKEEYNKVMEENKQLVDALVSGKQIELPEPEPEVDLNALRSKIFNTDGNDITDLEYAETVLALREELIKRGELDPFVTKSHDYVPTQADYDDAENVAKALQYAVDVANGNPGLFRSAFQDCIVDSAPANAQKILNKRR